MTGNTIAAQPVIAFERSGPSTEGVGGTLTRAGHANVAYRARHHRERWEGTGHPPERPRSTTQAVLGDAAGR